MLGFVAAVLVENATGKNVIQQTQTEQFPIALIVITFIIASLVPIVRGVPRKGNSIFTADAELWNGRLVSTKSVMYMQTVCGFSSVSVSSAVKSCCESCL